MRLFIPPLGTKITLTEEWRFQIMCEYRNQSFWDLLNDTPKMRELPWQASTWNSFRPVQLNPGDMLIVDRIYIRKGAKSFDSVTFRAHIKHLGVIRKVRFWVRLEDANNIIGEIKLP